MFAIGFVLLVIVLFIVACMIAGGIDGDNLFGIFLMLAGLTGLCLMGASFI